MTALADRVYQRSPVALQQAMVALYGAWWYRRRFSPLFHQVVAGLLSHQGWSAEQYRAYQEERLAQVLQAAWNSPHYAQVFRAAGITPEMPPFQALACLPLLSKETLRATPRALLTSAHMPRDVVVFNSSGSTGTPTDIYYTPLFHAWEMAVSEVYNLRWAGVNYRSRRVMFGVRKICRFDQPRPPFWRYSPAENMAYASVYHLSPHNLPHYRDFLRAYHPEILMGYPSSLQTVARFLLEAKTQLEGVKAVFTTAETLTPAARETIEAAFGARIFDRYGAVENCMYASQCQHGRYHVIPEVGILEILDASGQPCPPGVAGEVVATGLQNTLQPLIRYRIGDVAAWALEQTCPCGRSLPLLEGIAGRVEDTCITADGREILRFDTVFKHVTGIRRAQVIQTAIDSFTIKIEPDRDDTQFSEQQIRANMQQHVGSATVVIERVSEIPRTAAGKFRAVLCLLPPSEKQRLRRKP